MHRFVRGVPVLLAIAAATTAVHAAPRVYVASTGVDSAPCTLAQPCRSFAAAHANVDSGGEIVALDAAGYGALTITKSVTITANPGVFAGIAASTGAAVTIGAPDIAVTLRNLHFNGTGADHGVLGHSGRLVVVENCTFSNFLLAGIGLGAFGMQAVVTGTVVSGSGNGFVALTGAKNAVANSRFLFNGYGINVAGSPTRLAIADSVLVGNGTGIVAANGGAIAATRVLVASSLQSGIVADDGTVTVGYSQVSYNQDFGFLHLGGTFWSLGNNQVLGNGGGASYGTISSLAPM